MKTLLNSVAIGLAGTLCLGVFNTRANLEISTSVQITAKADFYTPLSAHGAWIDVDSYGRCWRPGSVAVEWQPYCYGHWVWTDCGWYWASDEPWGWACYHYGRWVRHSHHGWVWIPDTEWAPAWVSWRVGGGYVGWAPMSPRVGVFVSVPAPPFFFVEMGRFREPVRPSRVIVNNTTIINKTTVINNNMKSETRSFGDSGPQKVMINEGPGLAGIEKATGKKVQQVAIHEAVRQTPGPQGLDRRTGEKTAGSGEKVKPSSGSDRPKVAPSPRPERSESPGSPPKSGSPDKDKGPSRDSDRHQAAPSPRQDRNDNPGLPPKLGPPGKDKEPPREGVVPSPERPVEKPFKSGKEKGKGRGSDRF
jgi:hypothetical protein